MILVAGRSIMFSGISEEKACRSRSRGVGTRVASSSLLSAAPSLEVREEHRIRLEGDIPSAAKPPSGCVFHTRCPRKIGPICENEQPALLEEEPGHFIRCHIPIEELRRLQKPAAAQEAG